MMGKFKYDVRKPRISGAIVGLGSILALPSSYLYTITSYYSDSSATHVFSLVKARNGGIRDIGTVSESYMFPKKIEIQPNLEYVEKVYAAIKRARGAVNKLPLENRQKHYSNINVYQNKFRPLVENIK